VRHQLFDIDLKVRKTVQRSTVVASFVGVFFLASETAEGLVESAWGPFVGLAAAGALAVAGRPLERVAERFAGHVMPGVKPLEGMTKRERAALYREQAALAALDGITEKDRRMLDGLRARLGLDAEEAARLEREAAPPPQRRMASSAELSA
jgi:hypothetical protein